MRFKIIFFIISPSLFVLLRLIADIVVTYNIILNDSRASQTQFIFKKYNQSVQLEFTKNMLIMNNTRSYITAIQNIRLKTNYSNFQSLETYQFTDLYYYASTFSSFIKNLELQILCENGFIATYNQQINIEQYRTIQQQCNYITNCDLYLQQIDKKTLRFSNNNIQLVSSTIINNTKCSIIETHNELFSHLNNTYIMVDNIIYYILNQTYQQIKLNPVSNQTDQQYNLAFLNMKEFRPYIRLQSSIFFISLSLIILIFLLIFWRYAVKLAYSFVIPLHQFTQISIIEIEQIDISSLQQKQTTCSEIRDISQCLIQSIKMLQIYHKQFGLDAQSLIELSEAKIFFRSINNLAAVGICCNNIACIHYNHKRYLEALNEQEESIQIGEQEYEGLQQMEKLQSQLSSGSGQMNLLDFYNRFKRTVLRRFFREDTILERINSNQLKQNNNQSYFVGFLTKPRSQTVGIPSEIRSPSVGDISLVDDEEISNCKIKLVNRKYQLLRILIQFSNENNQLFLAEIFSIIKQLINEIQQIKPQNENLMILQASLQTKLIYFYSITNQIQKARHLLLRLNLRTNLVRFTIPYLRAVIDIKENRIKEGCFKLIDILNNRLQDQKYYQAALNLLMEIFKKYQLNNQLLNNYLLNKIQLQIVLLIDYSSDMTIQQLNLSHTYSKYILSILEENDLVTLYAYNETLYQIFPFQENHQFLQNCLTKLLVPLGGQANVLQSLCDICKRMFTFNKKMIMTDENQYEMKSPCQGDILDSTLLIEPHDQIVSEIKNNFEKRYIVLFAEFINDFSEYQFEILKNLMIKRYINLVIIGISNSNKSKKYMQLLETITEDSIWLRTQKDIKNFFESQKNPKKIQYYNLEIF